MNKHIIRAYWYGFFTYVGINMCIQDSMGLEGYVTFVRQHWVELHPVVGAALAAVCCVLFIGLQARFIKFDMEVDEEVNRNV